MYTSAILIKKVDNLDENGNPKIDDYGREIISEAEQVKIPVEVTSCGQSEFFKAGQEGYKPEVKLITFIGNYDGEEEIVLEGVRYKIYRTFSKNNENIELYLTKKLG